MSRVKRGMTAHARHKKIMGMAKGYRGRSKNVFRVAVEKVEKALNALMEEIKKSFDRHHIAMDYPHMNIHMIGDENNG